MMVTHTFRDKKAWNVAPVTTVAQQHLRPATPHVHTCREETLSNVQGRKQRSSGVGSSSSSSGPGVAVDDELVVVTILLAARPQPSSSASSDHKHSADSEPALLGLRYAAAAKGDSGSSGGSGRSGLSRLFGGFGGKRGGGRLEGEGGEDVEESGWVSHLDGVQGVRRALLALSGVRASQLLAVEVLWTPEQAGDTFSREDLLEDYPHLQPL